MHPHATELEQGVRRGDRRALARAITLAESTREDHRREAESLLDALMPATGDSIRLGVSGTPGVGKSTFIEAFGRHVTGLGRKLAVLAVDPTSRIGGGSILGDKTRMETLCRTPEAFIRPSPSGATLGGVARRTREAMLLCEAAGFDVIVVETVGVGQSETAVVDMVDMFLLLLSPGGGGELQGIKRGIVELADLMIVNKADGDMLAAAARSMADYKSAARYLRRADPDWQIEILACSAKQGTGIDAVWDTVGRYREALGGRLAERRAKQLDSWLWSDIQAAIADAVRSSEQVAEALRRERDAVRAGARTPAAAARSIVAELLGRP